MAIFYAFASPQIEVLGMTTVYGNVDVSLATENALRLTEVAGVPSIPVARGAARPLRGEYGGAVDFVHGTNGQGDAKLPGVSRREDERRATEFIWETVRAYPHEVTLITLGPLTNIGLALIERPEIADFAKGVVAMGGNVHSRGNATMAAEANIVNDPEAAEIVFSAPWDVTICGLDVTHRILMTPADLQRIYRIDSPVGRYLSAIVPFYHRFYTEEVGCDGIYVHDSTTLSYLLRPDLFRTERHVLVVDTGDGVGRGKTWPVKTKDAAGRDARYHNRPFVTVCVDVDSRSVIETQIADLAAT